jgi:hypothetical protein
MFLRSQNDTIQNPLGNRQSFRLGRIESIQPCIPTYYIVFALKKSLEEPNALKIHSYKIPVDDYTLLPECIRIMLQQQWSTSKRSN